VICRQLKPASINTAPREVLTTAQLPALLLPRM
jgi:hypothetical protein